MAVTPREKRKLFQVAWDSQENGAKEREERAVQAASKELNIKWELITLESYLREGINLAG